MAIPSIIMGGGPNPPVQLDPWRRAVGVQWPPRWYKVRVGIVGSSTFGQFGPTSPEDFTVVFFSNNSLTSTRMRIVDNTPNAVHRWRGSVLNGDWEVVPSADRAEMEFSFPTFDHIDSFSPWQYVGSIAVGSWTPHMGGPSNGGTALHDGYPPSTSGSGGESFRDGFQVEVRYGATPFTGYIFNRDLITFGEINYLALTIVASHVADFANATMTFRGVTQPLRGMIANSVTMPPDSDHPQSTTRFISLLFGREAQEG